VEVEPCTKAMTRRRWIADEISGNHAALTGRHADHLTTVLRARLGQQFDIATPNGVRRGRITRLDQDRVEFALGEPVPAFTFPNLTLALSVFKFDRMEWAIEKCTELGVKRLVPVIARRTEAHLAAAAAKRQERWQRIARQASEQSRRPLPPEISQPMKLNEAVALPGSTRVLLAESEPDAMLADVLDCDRSGEIVLAIGPEGGWTDSELAAFRGAGWRFASLGSTILRAETAAIAATAVSLSMLGGG
jgi:16S rRNA (uracil1498-N3)-methyltransferase